MLTLLLKSALLHAITSYDIFLMKATTLILAMACAVGFSSCCCQSQSMPPLRPMPTGECCSQDQGGYVPVEAPVKQLPVVPGK